MHIPKLYREEDRELILDFLKRNNFPAIVSYDGQRPVATHTPVEVEERGDNLIVYGHMSRSNPQWKMLEGQEVLLIFQGPHTYISPRWYNHVNVPTWNYTIVHVYGTVREMQGDELFGLLSRLVKNHEPSGDYSLEALPPDFVQKEMKGVWGFVMEVTKVDAGYKLSQNRNDEDHTTIVSKLDERKDDDSKRIAEAMREQRGRTKV